MTMCRVCLNETSSTKCKNIFSEYFHKKLLAEILSSLSSIQVIQHEKYPEDICGRCLKNLHASYDFKTLIITSNDLLKELYSGVPPKLEETNERLKNSNTQTNDNFHDPITINIKSEKANYDEESELLENVDLKNESNQPTNNLDDMALESRDIRQIERNKDNTGSKMRTRKYKTKGMCRRTSKLARKQETNEKCYTCSDCQKSFTSRRYLNRHSKIHTGIKPHVCEICKKPFLQKGALKVHVRVHSNEMPYKCDICLKAFRFASALRTHKFIHLGIKPYKCRYCDKAFRQSVGLHTHERTHTGEKPYVCEVCSKSCGDMSALIRHRRIHCNDNLPCPICGKVFKIARNLKLHQQRHSGDKPYACELCGQRFTARSTVKRHMFIHEGIRPYACKICGKAFSQSNILVRHMRVHTGEKPYACSLCPKKFPYSQPFVKHMNQHERGLIPKE